MILSDRRFFLKHRFGFSIICDVNVLRPQMGIHKKDAGLAMKEVLHLFPYAGQWLVLYAYCSVTVFFFSL